VDAQTVKLFPNVGFLGQQGDFLSHAFVVDLGFQRRHSFLQSLLL
jgi:hypothetical protein